jgi:hypothetical protein
LTTEPPSISTSQNLRISAYRGLPDQATLPNQPAGNCSTGHPRRSSFPILGRASRRTPVCGADPSGGRQGDSRRGRDRETVDRIGSWSSVVDRSSMMDDPSPPRSDGRWPRGDRLYQLAVSGSAYLKVRNGRAHRGPSANARPREGGPVVLALRIPIMDDALAPTVSWVRTTLHAAWTSRIQEIPT